MKEQGWLVFEDKEESQPKRPWTVARLNREVRSCLEGQIGAVWVEGEISNLRRQPSGHSYFSLKDDAAQVSCVMFRSSGAGTASLRDGMQVEVSGEIGVYEPRGQYQIVVRRVQPRGAGELEARLRALQEKLRAEGLLDNSRKRPLPPHPTRVGVVTSPAGAAVHDFLQVLRRRAPHIEVFIAPVRVQGRGAALEIAAAIACFTETGRSGFPQVDVLVVTRGGGSLEDLWEFNEESVARAIAASAVPVISAVGHETDVTTSDLVADVRAPTPSAAAEILSTDRSQTMEQLGAALRRLGREATGRIVRSRDQLASLEGSGAFQQPLRLLREWRQTIDGLQERGTALMETRLAVLRETGSRATSVLRARSPSRQLDALSERLAALRLRRDQAAGHALRQRRGQQTRHTHALELLGPRQTLRRGFTITMDKQRRPLTSAADAARQEEIVTVFADGETTSKPVP